MTNAQKRAQAELIRNVRIRQTAALIVLIAGLLASMAANIIQSLPLGWVGWAIAGLAPLALFGCMFLLELMGRDIPIAKLILSFVVLGGIALMSGYVSYLHIYRLSYETTHDVRISAIVPLMIDLPMILASVLLSETRKTLGRELPASAPVAPAKRTEAARAIVAKTARTRTTKIDPVTA
jgi:hypothetical protein